jgi:hypothetical protein
MKALLPGKYFEKARPILRARSKRVRGAFLLAELQEAIEDMRNLVFLEVSQRVRRIRLVYTIREQRQIQVFGLHQAYRPHQEIPIVTKVVVRKATDLIVKRSTKRKIPTGHG